MPEKPFNPEPVKSFNPEPVSAEPPKAKTWGEAVGNFAVNAINTVNPLPALESFYTDPIGTSKKILEAQGAQLDKAKESYKQGRYSEAVGHSLAYALPLIGPAAANAGEQIGSGDVSGGLGTSAGLLAPFGVNEIGKVKVSPGLRNPNPMVADAVDFGLKNDLPVDAATATGNRAVSGAQFLADRSLGGSIVATKAAQAGAERMATVGEELAQRANQTPSIGTGPYSGRTTPGVPVTPEQAGQGIQTALDSKITKLHGEANLAYDELRKIEADPKHLQTVQTGTKQVQSIGFNAQGQGPVTITKTVPITEDIPLAVDLRSAKAALKPIYERMQRQIPVAQQRASAGFKAVENIVNGKDFAPASIVDGDLSAIKSIARGADLPELKSVSQGLAAKAVQEAEDSLQTTIKNAGPDAVDALKRGRDATRAKYEVADVAKAARQEPVQAFNQAVYSNDSGIDHLREVAKHAPDELPKIGRAFLDDVLNTATKEGGFDKTGTIATKWQKLGPETKKLLFKDPGYINDLDNFFTLAKKMGENPNPSGTAHVLSVGGQLAYTFTNPVSGGSLIIGGAGLSKLMHSPAFVRALTEGLQVSGKGPAAVTAASQLVRMAGGAAKRVGDESSPSGQTFQPELVPAR